MVDCSNDCSWEEAKLEVVRRLLVGFELGLLLYFSVLIYKSTILSNY